jgi:hypothetical protein
MDTFPAMLSRLSPLHIVAAALFSLLGFSCCLVYFIVAPRGSNKRPLASSLLLSCRRRPSLRARYTRPLEPMPRSRAHVYDDVVVVVVGKMSMGRYQDLSARSTNEIFKSSLTARVSVKSTVKSMLRSSASRQRRRPVIIIIIVRHAHLYHIDRLYIDRRYSDASPWTSDVGEQMQRLHARRSTVSRHMLRPSSSDCSSELKSVAAHVETGNMEGIRTPLQKMFHVLSYYKDPTTRDVNKTSIFCKSLIRHDGLNLLRQLEMSSQDKVRRRPLLLSYATFASVMVCSMGSWSSMLAFHGVLVPCWRSGSMG